MRRSELPEFLHKVLQDGGIREGMYKVEIFYPGVDGVKKLNWVLVSLGGKTQLEKAVSIPLDFPEVDGMHHYEASITPVF